MSLTTLPAWLVRVVSKTLTIDVWRRIECGAVSDPDRVRDNVACVLGWLVRASNLAIAVVLLPLSLVVLLLPLPGLVMGFFHVQNDQHCCFGLKHIAISVRIALASLTTPLSN